MLVCKATETMVSWLDIHCPGTMHEMRQIVLGNLFDRQKIGGQMLNIHGLNKERVIVGF